MAGSGERRGPYKTRPGSILGVAAAFRQSPRYLSWGKSWAMRFDRHVERFAKANGNPDLKAIRRGDIVRALNEFADAPVEGNNWLKAMRALCDFALDIEEIDRDPTAGVKRLKAAHREGFRVWTEDEIDRYLGHHRPPTIAHRLFVLALYTGAARADLVRLGWQNVHGDAIQYRRAKTERVGGPLITVPILPPLAALLATIPRDQVTFLENRYGRPRSVHAVTGDMAGWVDEVPGLGDPDHLGRRLTTHGLRKALGRRLAEAGCSPHQIMSVLGHESISSAQVYTRAYDRAEAAAEAMGRIGNISPANGRVVRLKKR